MLSPRTYRRLCNSDRKSQNNRQNELRVTKAGLSLSPKTPPPESSTPKSTDRRISQRLFSSDSGNRVYGVDMSDTPTSETWDTSSESSQEQAWRVELVKKNTHAAPPVSGYFFDRLTIRSIPTIELCAYLYLTVCAPFCTEFEHKKSIFVHKKSLFELR
jgi:hypothetical protein